MVISECWFQTYSTCGESKKTHPDVPSESFCSLGYFQKACHISWKLAWCDISWSPGFNPGQDTVLGLQETQTLHGNLLISCSIHICKDVAKAAGKWYRRISSTNGMGDWPQKALWDFGLNSYFRFPTLSEISPVMHMKTLRPVVLLVNLLVVFFSILLSHSIYSPSFPHLMFLS